MEAAAFSLSMVDHGLDDSAIASISFMVARSTSPTPVKWMLIPLMSVHYFTIVNLDPSDDLIDHLRRERFHTGIFSESCQQ